MARAQSPDSGDSQFFICFGDAPWLNGQYTVWGKVTEGMENIDKIKRGEPVCQSRPHRFGQNEGGLICCRAAISKSHALAASRRTSE